MPAYAVVPSESESLHALTVPEHRTVQSWVCLYPSIVLPLGGDFSIPFGPLLWMQHKEPGKAKRRALSSLPYDVLFWRILWFLFTQPILAGNYSSPVSTAQQIPSAALPWICGWKVVWFCHLPHLGASSPSPGRVARDPQTTSISHHDLVPIVNRHTNPTDWWDPEKVAGEQWFLETHFLELLRHSWCKGGRENKAASKAERW